MRRQEYATGAASPRLGIITLAFRNAARHPAAAC